MLVWALAFFVIALLAAFLGFGIVAVTFAAVAKLTFYVAFILCVVSLVSAWMHRV